MTQVFYIWKEKESMIKIKTPLVICITIIMLGISVAPQGSASRAYTAYTDPRNTVIPTTADKGDQESPSVSNGSNPEKSTDRIIIRYRKTPTEFFVPAQDDHMQRLSQEAGINLNYFREMSGDAHVLRLPEKLPIEQVLQIAKKLANLPEVEYAEPDRIMRHTLVPNDPLYGQQWHYYESVGGINAPAAWDMTTGSSAIVIAILDTGITDHPDLIARSAPGLGYDFVSDTSMSNDGDGRDSNPRDPGDWCGSWSSSWHGTHVAGTIGAASNNGIGVAGVNWNSRLLHVRVLGCNGGYNSDIIDGLRWAAGLTVPGVPNNSHPARVLNLSLGGGYPCTPAWQSAINEVTSQGAVVVVSAGNENSNAANFTPAGCSGVITVAATDRNGSRASYSNYGSAVEISAPGGDGPDGVLSTLNDGTTAPGNPIYAAYQGTSMAAPHVSGVVSLMLSRNPSLTPHNVLTILQSTARPFPSGSNCNTSLCGSGIVDAAAAVSAAQPSIPPSAFNKIGPVNGSSNQPTDMTLRWNSSPYAFEYEYCYDTSNNNSCDTAWIPVTEDRIFFSNLSPNTTYYWQVRAKNTLGVTYADSDTWWSFTTGNASNDDFDYAISITTIPYRNTQSIVNATTADDDPSLCVYGQGQKYRTVWYRYTPSVNGKITIHTLGSNYDTILSVWNGSRGNLIELACNDDSDGTLQSRVELEISAGTTYYIEVAAYNNISSGELSLSLSRITNIIRNPGFEEGTTHWSEYSSGGFRIISNYPSIAHEGSYYAFLGGYNDAQETISQDITIPHNATDAYLWFWYRITTEETTTATRYDSMRIEIRNPDDNTVIGVLEELSNLNQTGTWWFRSSNYNMLDFRGQTIRLVFSVTNDSTLPTTFLVDTTGLMISEPPTVYLPFVIR